MKKIIVANWKMNPQNLREAKTLFNSVKKGLKRYSNILKNIRIVICPPFVYLPSLLNLAKNSKIALGAQDLFWEEAGAFTGEISPKMIKNLGCQYVIIGHSERHRILKETDEMINKKLKAALKAKLKPILCIGETEKERKQGKTFQILKKQLRRDLKDISNFEFRILNLILAYEPIWAIGTKNPCQPKEAEKVLTFLRGILKKNPILYGGSVNSKNARDYIKIGFDGLLVGGASLNAKEFLAILKSCFET